MRRSAFVTAVTHASVAGAALLAGCARSKKPDLNAFMARSRALTGYQDLDPRLGATYLQVAGASPSDRQILALWYTGVDSSKATTVTWVDALAWRACSFTKPPSQCAAPGSWHRKP